MTWEDIAKKLARKTLNIAHEGGRMLIELDDPAAYDRSPGWRHTLGSRPWTSPSFPARIHPRSSRCQHSRPCESVGFGWTPRP
ncbi:MAG: hypothetical protein ACI8RZ_003642 [Myxococcota bacterium]|jgi:hypothetical protein